MATKNYIPCAECYELKSEHSQFTDHDYEEGCYCADAGKCEVCVNQAVDYADHLRDAAKEG